MEKFILFLAIFAVVSLGFNSDPLGLPQNEAKDPSVIALTFDDGPNKRNLPLILEVLEKENVKATFFFVGGNVLGNKELVRETSRRGHEIANHSFGHERLDLVSDEIAMNSVVRTQNEIEKITGRVPKFFRPPFWMITKSLKEKIEELGIRVVYLGSVVDSKTKKFIQEKIPLKYQDINTQDYELVKNYKEFPSETAKKLASNVIRVAESREKAGVHSHILVFHELGLSAKALEEIIPYFKSRGFQFVTLSEYFKEE